MDLGLKLFIGLLICMDALTCYYIILVAKESYDKWKRDHKLF